MKKLVLIAVFPLMIFSSTKFSWPLFPFTVLTSSFYEYRITHFHGGVDLSTYRKEGLPVRAAAGGRIFRIFYGWYGFGRAIYIRHPGGYVTVYGHLSKFENRVLHLEDLVKGVARKRGVKYINTFYLNKPIPVRKGQVIGYSGAMGAGGPHLHFEIRKGEMQPVNPLFYLNAPVGRVHFGRFVLEVATPGSYVGMKPTRFYGKFERQGKSYGFMQIPVHGCFRVFIQAYERCKERCGVYSLQVFLDGREIFSSRGDSFAFSQNYIAGRLFNLSLSSMKSPLYSVPRFDSPPICIYHGNHVLTIKGVNEHGRTSVAFLRFVYVPPPYENGKIYSSLVKEIMVKKGKEWIKGKLVNLPEGKIFRMRARWRSFTSPWLVLENSRAVSSGESVEAEGVEYHIGWKKVYVDSYLAGAPLFCNNRCFFIASPEKSAVAVKNGFAFSVEEKAPGIEMDIPRGDYPGLSKVGISVVETKLPDELVPISKSYFVTPVEALLKKKATIKIEVPEKFSPEKAGIYRKFRKSWTYLGGEQSGRWWTAKSRLLGLFVLAKDQTPPRIYNVRVTESSVRAIIKDGGSGVNPLKITFILDGKKYIPDFDYDSGRAMLDIKVSPGWHSLTVKAEDFVGNRSFRIFRFRKR